MQCGVSRHTVSAASQKMQRARQQLQLHDGAREMMQYITYYYINVRTVSRWRAVV